MTHLLTQPTIKSPGQRNSTLRAKHFPLLPLKQTAAVGEEEEEEEEIEISVLIKAV